MAVPARRHQATGHGSAPQPSHGPTCRLSRRCSREFKSKYSATPGRSPNPAATRGQPDRRADRRSRAPPPGRLRAIWRGRSPRPKPPRSAQERLPRIGPSGGGRTGRGSSRIRIGVQRCPIERYRRALAFMHCTLRLLRLLAALAAMALVVGEAAAADDAAPKRVLIVQSFARTATGVGLAVGGHLRTDGQQPVDVGRAAAAFRRAGRHRDERRRYQPQRRRDAPPHPRGARGGRHAG